MFLHPGKNVYCDVGCAASTHSLIVPLISALILACSYVVQYHLSLHLCNPAAVKITLYAAKHEKHEHLLIANVGHRDGQRSVIVSLETRDVMNQYEQNGNAQII